MTDPCDACGESTADPLARTVRLTVDRAEVDAQRLCPDCFADWIARYDEEMRPAVPTEDAESDIIVD